jgi:hypothetical protein
MLNRGETELEIVTQEKIELDVWDVLEQLGISKAKWLEYAMPDYQESASGE